MNETKPDRTSQDTRTVAHALAWASALALLLTVAYAFSVDKKAVATEVLWALGLWMAGVAVGFLFGIPKILQQGQPSSPPPAPAAPGAGASQAAAPPSNSLYSQRVNTNLEEISDWLTKIIIGVGLVELKVLPVKIGELGRVVVRGMGTADYSSFGIAIVVFFCVTGFLFGYLLTRLYIQGALARAESGIASELSQLVVKVETTQAAVQVLKAGRARMVGAPGIEAKSVEDPKARLADFVEQYKATDNIVDNKERLAARDDVAAQMGDLVVSAGIPRAWLAEQPDEVYGLALAMASLTTDQPDDASQLLSMAERTTRLHIRYKIALAMARLHERGALGALKEAALTMLARFEIGADEALKRRLAIVRQEIGS